MERDAMWFTRLALGAAGAVPAIASADNAHLPIKTISGASGDYQLRRQIGNTDQYRLYECGLPDGRWGILKIATDRSYNGNLQREDFNLSKMMRESLEVDRGRAEREKYDHHVGFPKVEESFILESQDKRRVNVLSFIEWINDISLLEPAFYIVDRDQEQVDPRTGAWMIGKPLKTLSFAHRYGIANKAMSRSNLLLNKKEHWAIVFDWTQSEFNSDPHILRKAFRDDIAQLALVGIEIMGGDLKTGKLPDHEQLTDGRYERLIREMAEGKYDDALELHGIFYKLIRELWPKEFHPYTATKRTH